MIGDVKMIGGGDDKSRTIAWRGKVLRGILPPSAAATASVLRTCESAGLFARGLVGTRRYEGPLPPDFAFPLVLEHERVPVVTYPHEWPAEAFRQAALFHLDLFGWLARAGLTLRDWHPWNVLFVDNAPVFVDFTSIVPLADLPHEEYLALSRTRQSTGAAVEAMYRRMFVPYFLLPLRMMAQGRHAEARRRLLATTLNASEETITAAEVLGKATPQRLAFEVREARKRALLLDPRALPRRFFLTTRRELSRMRVAPEASAYTDYYAAKGEDAPLSARERFTAKQRAVDDLLAALKPATVLDVACNTGWFSRLAAGHGARVIGMDIDEGCVEVLRRGAAQDGLQITALVGDVMSLCGDVPSTAVPGATVLVSAQDRLRSDVVLALAVVHHLVLGAGHSIEDVVAALAALTSGTLILEHVALDDEKVLEDPSFFPALAKRRDGFDRDAFVAALRRRFRRVTVRPSAPATRSILVATGPIADVRWPRAARAGSSAAAPARE